MNTRAVTFLLLGLFAHGAHSQAPDPQAIANQLGPEAAKMMESMLGMQDKYQRIKKERESERRAIVDAVAQEERERAMANAASLQSQGIDPMSVAEVESRKRLDALNAQWKIEDAKLEAEMQADMQRAMAETGLPVPPAPR
jgi:nitrogen fixation/metabolism regulation signal transduction histidine kinase